MDIVKITIQIFPKSNARYIYPTQSAKDKKNNNKNKNVLTLEIDSSYDMLITTNTLIDYIWKIKTDCIFPVKVKKDVIQKLKYNEYFQ